MNTSIFRAKEPAIERIFGRGRAVIGVIHSLPLPGSPHYDGELVETIYQYACDEAERYGTGGVDGLIVENHGDIPFAKPDELGPETAACMAVMADRVRRASGLPIGINVLANGAIAGIAVAKASGAAFVRVNQWANAYVANEGFMEGKAGAASRYRAALRACRSSFPPRCETRLNSERTSRSRSSGTSASGSYVLVALEINIIKSCTRQAHNVGSAQRLARTARARHAAPHLQQQAALGAGIARHDVLGAVRQRHDAQRHLRGAAASAKEVSQTLRRARRRACSFCASSCRSPAMSTSSNSSAANLRSCAAGMCVPTCVAPCRAV